MTLNPRNLFNIVLKVFGLFFLREIINEALVTVSVLLPYFSVSDLEITIGTLIVSILILGFYIVLTLQLLFRTNFLIDVLKLDKGFSEHDLSIEKKQEYKISLSTSEILIISLTILGGFILVDEIPDFCKQLYLFVDEKKSSYRGTAPSMANILTSAAKILIGLLILGERKKIINFIQDRKDSEPNETA